MELVTEPKLKEEEKKKTAKEGFIRFPTEELEKHLDQHIHR